MLRAPAAIVVLVFASLSSIPLWSWLGVARMSAPVVIRNTQPESVEGDVRFSGAAAKSLGSIHFNLPSQYEVRLSTVEPSVWSGLPGLRYAYRYLIWRWDLPCNFLWAPVVMLFVSGNVLVRRSLGSAAGQVLPALPVGPRSRALAEAGLALALVLVARTPGLFLHPAEMLFTGSFVLEHGLQPASSGLAWRESTLLGAFFAWPLLLAWATVRRLDRRALLAPGLVMTGLGGWRRRTARCRCTCPRAPS
jgi:hypothetical protein